MMKRMSTQRARACWRRGVGDDDVDRRDHHENDAGLGQHPADDPFQSEQSGSPRDDPLPIQRRTSMAATIAAAISEAERQAFVVGTEPAKRSMPRRWTLLPSCAVMAASRRHIQAGGFPARPPPLASGIAGSRPRRSKPFARRAAASCRPAGLADCPWSPRSARDGRRTCGSWRACCRALRRPARATVATLMRASSSFSATARRR